jgi:poly(A) polymerase
MVPLLANVPISRLFDEMIKLLQTGHALASLEQMKRFGLVGGGTPIFPVLEAALSGSGSAAAARATFVRLALEDTDRRVGEGRPVAPSFLLACLLWHDVQERWTALKAKGEGPFPALQQAVDAVFDARIGDISGRGKLAADMREIWLMQPRFDRRTPSGAHSLAAQARFRAGYDFLRLRADAREASSELADWWEDFHLGSEEDREALLADVKPAAGGPRVRRGAAEAPAAAGDEGEGADDDNAGEAPTEGEASDPAAPRKRRRRRRRGPRPDGGAAPAAPE